MIAFDDILDMSKRQDALYGFDYLVRPTATERKFAPLFRAVCCAWCHACDERIIDPDARRALANIEAFMTGQVAGDALAIARKTAAIAARRVARCARGKTKEYWACHAVCEAARNSAWESLIWTSRATMNAALYLDQKIDIFRKVVEAPTYPCLRQLPLHENGGSLVT